VNALVVGLFYVRYQRSYRARLRARERALRLPGVYGAGSSAPAPPLAPARPALPAAAPAASPREAP
jgi:hypothetical protein